MGILAWIVFGLVVGLLARLVVPGRDPMGIIATIILGIVGSFVGGLIVNLFTGNGVELSGASFLGSLLGAVAALLIYRRVRRA